MTDAVLTFRGIPTLVTGQSGLSYGRCLFRVAIGQPFNSSLRKITLESHLAMTIAGFACEGYIEPDESAPVITMRPRSDAHIGPLFEAMGGTLPDYNGERPFDQLTLRIHLASAAWEMFAANGIDDEVVRRS